MISSMRAIPVLIGAAIAPCTGCRLAVVIETI